MGTTAVAPKSEELVGGTWTEHECRLYGESDEEVRLAAAQLGEDRSIGGTTLAWHQLSVDPATLRRQDPEWVRCGPVDWNRDHNRPPKERSRSWRWPSGRAAGRLGTPIGFTSDNDPNRTPSVVCRGLKPW